MIFPHADSGKSGLPKRISELVPVCGISIWVLSQRAPDRVLHVEAKQPFDGMMSVLGATESGERRGLHGQSFGPVGQHAHDPLRSTDDFFEAIKHEQCSALRLISRVDAGVARTHP